MYKVKLDEKPLSGLLLPLLSQEMELRLSTEV